jgi:hypothetical protein
MKQIYGIASSMLKKGVVLAVLAAAPIAAVAGPGGSNRPYASICDTVVHVIQTQPILTLSVDLACQVRHLGRTTGLIIQDVVPTGPPVNGVLPVALDATVVYVAANGDELRATFLGTGEINLVTGDVTFEGIETFNGGTGRFQNATGSSFLEGTASNVTNVGFYTSVGRISY